MRERHSPAPSVTVDGLTCTATYQDGQVRIHLPFAVDLHALSQQLMREGYALAHQPDTPDTQGWGDRFDPGGYYPYWLFPDPDRPGQSVFAFYPHPEDLVQRADNTALLHLGERSLDLVRRWVPVLATRMEVR
jgi:hypothetical protein